MDFVCQSNLGRSDGGRETWAYQFIPALLRRHPDLQLRLYGQRLDGLPDSTPELVEAVGENAPRFSAHFFPTARTRWPLLMSMVRQFAQWKKREPRPIADVAIAAGCVAELIVILGSRAGRRAFKIVWLRTLLMDSKASRIPAPLRGLARHVEGRILSRADLLLCNGVDIAEYYRNYGLDVQVVKNAVDSDRWDLPAPAATAPVHVAYVGRLTREKGIEQFLKVARSIKSSPDADRFVFHVIGSVGNEQLLEPSLERGDIEWHGMLGGDDLRRALATIDVCVAFTFASAESGGGGTSNAMMEQLAARRVVIAWDNVIFRQWLTQDNAYLVPQGDVESVATALREIARDPAGARARAEAGREAVLPFGVPAMMDRFDHVLAEAMSKRDQARSRHSR